MTFDIGSYQRPTQACVRVHFDNLIAYALAPAFAKSSRTLRAVKRGIRRRSRVLAYLIRYLLVIDWKGALVVCDMFL